MATILIIDDEEQVRTLFKTALEEAGYGVMVADSGKQGLCLLHDQAADLILVDIFMPGMDGLELIRQMRKIRPASKIIAMSGGSAEWNFLDVAKMMGAHGTLKKPLGLKELRNAVSSQLKPDYP
jgi:DNA-binding response OmpR family regulator